LFAAAVAAAAVVCCLLLLLFVVVVWFASMVYFYGLLPGANTRVHTSTVDAYSWVKLLHAHVFESGDTDCYAAYPIRIWAFKEKALFDGLSQLSFAFLGYGCV